MIVPSKVLEQFRVIATDILVLARVNREAYWPYAPAIPRLQSSIDQGPQQDLECLLPCSRAFPPSYTTVDQLKYSVPELFEPDDQFRFHGNSMGFSHSQIQFKRNEQRDNYGKWLNIIKVKFIAYHTVVG